MDRRPRLFRAIWGKGGKTVLATVFWGFFGDEENWISAVRLENIREDYLENSRLRQRAALLDAMEFCYNFREDRESPDRCRLVWYGTCHPQHRWHVSEEKQSEISWLDKGAVRI